ncbi:MAG TPA: PQQ-binding-like beta-propeller repeat protein [candidate division Zixibacteria bacterium]|nr:PQQ-binding-like beta-propeller repeat protein [candidate division Zixibacteria bacterium]
MKILRQLAIQALFLTGISAAPCLATQDTDKIVWTHDSDSKISYFRIVDDTLLLFGTEAGIFCVNADVRDTVWSKPAPDSVRGWTVGQITGTPLLLLMESRAWQVRKSRLQGGGLTQARKNTLSVLDVRTGAPRWNSQSAGIHSVCGFFLTPDSTNLILLTADSSRAKSLRSVDFSTNTVRWVNDTAFAGASPGLVAHESLDSLTLGLQRPIFDGHSAMITFITPGILRKWDLATGAVLWESEIRGNNLSPLSEGFMQMRFSDDNTRLYVPSHKYLNCLDVATGEIIWESPKMYGHVYQVEETVHGVLVRGGYYMSGKDGFKDYMILLDPETGQYLWNKQLTKFKTPWTSNYLVFYNDYAYVTSDRKLYKVYIPDGSYEIVAEQLDLRGNLRLFRDEQNIRVISGETVALMETNGNTLFNTTYQLPSSGSFWSTFATVLAVAALAVAVGVAATSDGGTFVYVPPVSYGRTLYGEVARASDSTICMVTEIQTATEKGPGVVWVRLKDGATLGKVIIGDKTPTYDFSESFSMLYLLEDDSRITAFRFE